MSGPCRVEYDCDPLEPRRDLGEQLKPLASQRGFVVDEAGDVPARAVKPGDDAAGDGIVHAHKDDRDRRRLALDGSGRRSRGCQDDVGLGGNQLLRDRPYPVDVTAGQPKVHPHVAAIGPTQARKRLRECRRATLHLRIVSVAPPEHADAPHPLALLRARRDWPCRRAAESGEEFAPSKPNAHVPLPCEETPIDGE
jgi:hypothetical protein